MKDHVTSKERLTFPSKVTPVIGVTLMVLIIILAILA